MSCSKELKDAIVRYKIGDEEAFSVIYEESKVYIAACIRNALADNYDREEIILDTMQETYLEISRNIDQLENADSFLNWAAVIAKRKAYALLKKDDRYVLVDENGKFEKQEDTNSSLPEDIVIDKEKQEIIREAIDKELTQDEKDCVVGYYYNDMKQKDIAKQLEMPKNTVVSNIFRAKSKLKLALRGVLVLAAVASIALLLLNIPAIKKVISIKFKKEEVVYDSEIPVEQKIPDGAKYYSARQKEWYLAGETFKGKRGIGDKYYIGGYIYTLNHLQDNGSYTWSVVVHDKNLETQGPILSQIGDRPVTNLKEAFKNCTNLKEAPEIPDSATDISGMFWGCTNLVKAPKIPEGVVDISNMFRGCTSLSEAPKIPEGVENISDVFSNCKSLKNVPVIPESVKEMTGAFYHCESITQVPNIPAHITDIDSLWSGCISITTVPEIPENVTDISGLFSGWTQLTKAPKIPEGVTDISGTFMGCINLTEGPKIPNSVTKMSNTFSGCTNLEKAFAIPENVTDICGVYKDCHKLKGELRINCSLYSVDKYRYWISDKAIHNVWLTGSDCVYDYKGEILGEGYFIIPEGCRFVSDDLDLGEGEWLTIGHPSNGTKYYTDDYVFTYTAIWEAAEGGVGCYVWTVKVRDKTKTSYTDIRYKFPTGIIKNNDIYMLETFAGCTNMKEAPAIPYGVENIDYAFLDCKNLTKAPKVHETVKSMKGTFIGCTSLADSVQVDSDVNIVQYGDTVKISLKRYIYPKKADGTVDFNAEGKWEEIGVREVNVSVYNDYLCDENRETRLKYKVDDIIGKKVNDTYEATSCVRCRRYEQSYGYYDSWYDTETICTILAIRKK